MLMPSFGQETLPNFWGFNMWGVFWYGLSTILATLSVSCWITGCIHTYWAKVELRLGSTTEALGLTIKATEVNGIALCLAMLAVLIAFVRHAFFSHH